jgi:hypothetical protein
MISGSKWRDTLSVVIADLKGNVDASPESKKLDLEGRGSQLTSR